MKKILGFTEEITTCECCGKQNLKGTYAIEIDGMNPVYFGSSCAFKKHVLTKEQTKVADKAYSSLKASLFVSGSKTIEEHNEKVRISFKSINEFRVSKMGLSALPESEMRLLKPLF